MLWFRQIFSRKRLRSELREEIEGHIAERADLLIARGADPAEAQRRARVAFGNITLAHERSVEIWRLGWLESIWADLRIALLQLRKAPGYALTAVLTLAIGVGANTAIFTVIDDAMLRSLPVTKPAELVTIGYRSPDVRHFIPEQFWPVMTELHGLQTISDLAGWTESMVTVPDDQNTLRSISAFLTTGNALEMLGIRPALGRLLSPADDVPGGPEGGWPVVVNYGFWLANFHGDPSIVGRHLLISGQPAVIVGVLPQKFQGLFVGTPLQLYLPIHFLSALASSPEQDPFVHPGNFAVLAVARLQPGTSLGLLNAQLRAMTPAIMHDLLPLHTRQSRAFRHAQLAAESARRGFSEIAEDYSRPLLLIQGIVLSVLLLCCVNLAGLQIARLESRQHEFGLRSALGAPRRRIVQQCLVESLFFATLGSLFAVALAWFSVKTISSFFTPAGSDLTLQLQPDAHMLLFTAALALLTTFLFGLAPAVLAARTPPHLVLKAKGTNARHQHLARQRFLIPSQFALALALVFTAGLFTHTLTRLRENHAGFSPVHVMEVTAQFQALKKSPQQIMELYRSMTEFLRTSPGVESAAYTWVTPLTGFAPQAHVHEVARSEEEHSVSYNDVGDGYFATIGTHLTAGREFTDQDRDRSTCIVNEGAARLLFPGGHALGDSLEAANTEEDREGQFTATCRVVGVVEDARYSSLRDPAPPTVYFPACQSTVVGGGYANNLVFFIRSRNARDAISAYRAALARFAPSTGYMIFLPLAEQLDQSIGSERLIARLSSAFAVVALLLSGVGLFGILALRVQQRRPEMGVRLAVGASRSHILALVFRDAFTMVSVGLLAGIVLIAATLSVTRRFLYDTSPVQLSVVASALLALVLVAVIATWLPARRAAGLDPLQVLREE